MSGGLTTTLAALSEAADEEADDIRYYSGGSNCNASLAKFHNALTEAYRSGHLIVKPDREALLEPVARALCEANTAQRVQRDVKLTEEERHEIVECQVHNGWDLWLPEANAALTAILGEK